MNISIRDAVCLEDTWVIKEGQQSERKGIYTDYIQVGMIMMRIILGTVTPRSKCKVTQISLQSHCKQFDIRSSTILVI